MAEIPNRTLQRGLDMLELLGAHAEGLALCELAQALRLPRSTAFNLAQTLTRLGYATQREDTGKYRLGLKMFEIGAGAMHQVDVMELIRGCMAEVHHKINETMHLGVRAEREAVGLPLPAGQQHLNELGNGEDAHNHAQPKGNQDAQVGCHRRPVTVAHQKKELFAVCSWGISFGQAEK